MTHSIMLIDDDKDLRTLMGLILKRTGYLVAEASNPDDALAMLNNLVPDLFILDVMMPGMNGFDLCRILKANKATAKRPVILLSARADEASRREGLASGADLYLVKPTPAHELSLRVAQLLNVEVSQTVSM
jgi:DNA-binding response OmpR family regulator